jgi:ABC-type molybdate transport system substrate-binding protein
MYKIYHPVNGINHDCKLTNLEYQLVGSVLADSLEQAFIYSQGFSSQWENTGNRSTSIGDVITNGDTYYMVKGIGFREIAQPTLNRITLVKNFN